MCRYCGLDRPENPGAICTNRLLDGPHVWVDDAGVFVPELNTDPEPQLNWMIENAMKDEPEYL